MIDKELYKKIVENNGQCMSKWCKDCPFNGERCKLHEQIYVDLDINDYGLTSVIKNDYCENKLKEITIKEREDKLKRILNDQKLCNNIK
jgi:hypothetical protein